MEAETRRTFTFELFNRLCYWNDRYAPCQTKSVAGMKGAHIGSDQYDYLVSDK